LQKTHTIGETLIKPAAIAVSEIMNGEKVTEEIKDQNLQKENSTLNWPS